MHKVGLVISLKQQKAAQQIGLLPCQLGHAKDDVETETRAEMVGAHAVLKFRSSLAAARSHLLWLLALASEPGSAAQSVLFWELDTLDTSSPSSEMS